MASGVVRVGAEAHHRLDNDPPSSAEINGAEMKSGPPLIAQNGTGNGSETVADATTCDSHNKIIIKSKQRTVPTEPGQDPSGECNELVVSDVGDIQRLYETNPETFQQWLMQKAPSDLLTRIRHRDTTSSTEQFASSDLFHRWIAFSPTKVSYLGFGVLYGVQRMFRRKRRFLRNEFLVEGDFD